VVICLKQGANDFHMVQLMPLPPHASLKFTMIEPFYSRLTQVVLEERPLNGCLFKYSVLELKIFLHYNGTKKFPRTACEEIPNESCGKVFLTVLATHILPTVGTVGFHRDCIYGLGLGSYLP